MFWSKARIMLVGHLLISDSRLLPSSMMLWVGEMHRRLYSRTLDIVLFIVVYVNKLFIYVSGWKVFFGFFFFLLLLCLLFVGVRGGFYKFKFRILLPSCKTQSFKIVTHKNRNRLVVESKNTHWLYSLQRDQTPLSKKKKRGASLTLSCFWRSDFSCGLVWFDFMAY